MSTRHALVAGLLGVPALWAQGPQKVQVGARPEFTFQREILFGAGVESLADLRGKPTLIEFWGTR